jgi:hypothetical protein
VQSETLEPVQLLVDSGQVYSTAFTATPGAARRLLAATETSCSTALIALNSAGTIANVWNLAMSGTTHWIVSQSSGLAGTLVLLDTATPATLVCKLAYTLPVNTAFTGLIYANMTGATVVETFILTAAPGIAATYHKLSFSADGSLLSTLQVSSFDISHDIARLPDGTPRVFFKTLSPSGGGTVHHRTGKTVGGTIGGFLALFLLVGVAVFFIHRDFERRQRLHQQRTMALNHPRDNNVLNYAQEVWKTYNPHAPVYPGRAGRTTTSRHAYQAIPTESAT